MFYKVCLKESIAGIHASYGWKIQYKSFPPISIKQL